MSDETMKDSPVKPEVKQTEPVKPESKKNSADNVPCPNCKNAVSVKLGSPGRNANGAFQYRKCLNCSRMFVEVLK